MLSKATIMSKTKKIVGIGLILTILLSTACQDEILDVDDPTSPTDETFFETQQQLEIALAGVYGQLYATGNVPLPIWMDHFSDLGYARTPSSHWELQELGIGLIVPTTTGVELLWENFYIGIQRANNLLSKMDRAQSVTDPDRFLEIKGEALFLRAYYYHILLELYGDIPYWTEIATAPDQIIPRTSKATIAADLLSDLQTAAEILPDFWPASERGRASANAANALRGRIALYNGNMNIAREATLLVITNGSHSLDADYQAMLTDPAALNSSSEIILDLSYLEGAQAHQLNVLQGIILNGAFSDLVPTQQLVDLYETANGLPIDEDPLYDPSNPYENRDPRLKATLVVPGEPWLDLIFETSSDSLTTIQVSTGERVPNPSASNNNTVTRTGYVWKKFVNQDQLINNLNVAVSEFPIPLIRYAEVLLIYAEASIESGSVDQSVLDAINDVRSRAYGTTRSDIGNYPSVTSTDVQELRNVIKRERVAELANEGFRLIDLRRWGIVEKIMSRPVIGSPANGWTKIGGEESFVPSIDEDGLVDYSGAPAQVYSAIGNLDYRIVVERLFDPSKNLLWPIPQREIDAGGGVVTQNGTY